MFRNVFRLFVVFVVAVFVRQVIGMIMRAFSEMTGDNSPKPTAAKRPESDGELKKDPVCGTFVAVASSIKRNVDGQVVHFCSTTCRDKYRVA
jgi:YHS domain-containing protein